MYLTTQILIDASISEVHLNRGGADSWSHIWSHSQPAQEVIDEIHKLDLAVAQFFAKCAADLLRFGNYSGKIAGIEVMATNFIGRDVVTLHLPDDDYVTIVLGKTGAGLHAIRAESEAVITAFEKVTENWDPVFAKLVMDSDADKVNMI
jgi:hypothetical protein